VRRRHFIALLSTAAVWPLSARAQIVNKIARVGWLAPSGSRVGIYLAVFLEELRKLGYVEGQTITLEGRWAEGRQELLPQLAAELVRLELDVLVAISSAGVQAAMNATRTIPIVMATAGDPVGLGYVTSLARPGGNVTGPSVMNTDTIAKRLQLLKELVPGLARVAVLKNSVNPLHAMYWQAIEPAAQQLALELQALEIRAPEDFEAAFAAAKRGNAQALLAFDDHLTGDPAYRPQIVALTAASRLPAIHGFREFPDDGGLMSYGANMISHFRHAAKYVDKILKGAKPADLAIEQPTKLELVINMRTAKALGLTIPPALLARADEIIE
jgi:putative ABC transport system substrate-binding protein